MVPLLDPVSRKNHWFFSKTIRACSREFRGVTYVREVAENMAAVAKLPGSSYNFGSETTKNIHEITRDFLALIGKDIRLEDCPATRNLWMNCEKARKLGVDFSTVEGGLVKCAGDYNLIK